MTPEEWDRISGILEEALNLPPEERAAFLKRTCNDSAEVGRLEALIEAHERATEKEFMTGPVLGTDPPSTAPVVSEAVLRAIKRRYQNVEMIGQGGMSTVYKAREKETGAVVALKVPDSRVSEKALERFKAELVLTRTINHEGVVSVFEFQRVEKSGYFSMEFVDGESLDRILPRFGGLPTAKGLHVARQICRGLQAAHEKGVIHRDLKPGNVMLDEHGRAKVMDFGIAYSADRNEGDGTDIVGTPFYMSPEQFVGKEPDPRMDIFSMGLVLHEIFSGKRVSRDDANPPRDLDPTIPPEIRSVIRRCLEKNPEDRYSSAEDLIAALPDVSSLQAQGGGPSRPAGAKPGVWVMVVAVCLSGGFLLRGIFMPDPAPDPKPKVIGPMNHGRDRTVWDLAYSSDGSRLASAGEDRLIHLWNPTTRKKDQTLSGHTRAVTAVEFGPEDKFLVSGGSDKTVRVWNLKTGEGKTLRGHTEPVEAVAFDPEGGKVASGGMDNRVIVWDVASGRPLPLRMEHESDVRSVAFSRTGLLASGGYDETVRLWDATTGKLKLAIPRQGDWIEKVAFSRDGNYVASAGQNNQVRIWDIASDQEFRTLNGHTHWIRGLSFSPDMKWLVSASDDGTAKIWNVETRTVKETLEGGRGLVTAAACSPDGEHFALGFHDGTVEVHAFKP